MDLLTKFRLSCRQLPKTEKNNGCMIQEIPLHAIKPGLYQAKKIFKSDAIEELSCSIKKYGVLHPVTVRRLPDERYELIAGERRVRACNICGMLKIPAIVVEMNDNDSAVAALAENLCRENLNFIEEAEAYRNLLYHHGLTQEELSEKLGKPLSEVVSKTRLLRLSAVVREIICDNSLSEQHAKLLLRLESQEEQLEALEKITTEDLNVRQSEALVEEMLKKDVTPVKEAESHQEEQTRPKIRLISKKSLKDVRVFLNTVRRAIAVMRENGIDAESTESEYDTYYEYVIKIPKSGKKQSSGMSGDVPSV